MQEQGLWKIKIRRGIGGFITDLIGATFNYVANTTLNQLEERTNRNKPVVARLYKMLEISTNINNYFCILCLLSIF